MRIAVIVAPLLLCSIANAKLVPTPLITDPHPMQRIGWQETWEHLNNPLFTCCWGVSGPSKQMTKVGWFLMGFTSSE